MGDCLNYVEKISSLYVINQCIHTPILCYIEHNFRYAFNFELLRLNSFVCFNGT